ncbi:3',5'-cyclic nucleotide phosphodiesterase, related [Eimeria tenella]|uniref:3',5'-cyclic nucleotide phosphodiesterase, related n=1 Tax=Eimeria tenella TaxID=5802 RepID=U6L6W6_EIMTE|nr:3',5'-cyclic nucleotide phosphodiesterase, related [Eimeria tenella]CDJ43525.1 3',5'-cyclic nucleotide phosphodiesterase, related [Eimeria tenella]|eukprot:XP_013234275.1 3',5'-cyclic nucleotide phosphodiesterase, related [Eimeria tenella]
MVTMWGVWNSVASYRLEENREEGDFLSTEENTALEACTALSYLFGFLPVVILDVVLPSRTKYSWVTHLSFLGTSAATIIVRGVLNPRFIAPSFVTRGGGWTGWSRT